MRFVVTGTGRNGTGYAAALFTAAGLTCGHEDAFTEKPGIGETAAPRSGAVARAKEPFGRVKETLRRRRLDLDGDASWMAVPRLPRFRGVAFLQLRDPLAVIRSFTGTRFFSEPGRYPRQQAFAARHFTSIGDDVVDAMRWWVEWNERAARHADMVYRLEDLDPEIFAEMLSLLEEPDASGRAARAIAEVETDVNSGQRRGDRPEDLQWSDLPRGPELDSLRRVAERFGYAVDG